MKFERIAWVSLLLALPLLALSCGGDGQKPLPAEGIRDQGPAALATPKTPQEELLASIVLTADEVSEVFPSQEWIVFSQPEGALEEQRARGQVAGWSANYQPAQVADVLEVSTLLLMFETPEDAGRQFRDMSRFWLEAGPGVDIERFDVGGIGDESHGQVNRTPEVYTILLFRADTVVVSIDIPLGLSDEDRRADALQLAQKLAGKIDAAIRG